MNRRLLPTAAIGGMLALILAIDPVVDALGPPPAGSGYVRLRLAGLPAGTVCEVACWQQQQPPSGLWTGKAVAGGVMKKVVPADVPLLLRVVPTSAIPARTRAIVVPSGSAVDVVFDYADLARCTVQVVGAASESSGIRYATIDYLDGAVTGASRPSVEAVTDARGCCVVGGPVGRVFEMRVGGVRLVEPGTGRRSFVLAANAMYRVAPESRLALVDQRKAGSGMLDDLARLLGDTERWFAYTDAGLRSSVAGRLAVVEGEVARDLVVFDSDANYAVVPAADLLFGGTTRVDLEPSVLGLDVEVEGVVPPGCELVLAGPGPAALFTSRLPPIVRPIVEGRAGFGPLVPATYSLRWRKDGRSSPVVREVPVAEPGAMLRLEAPSPRQLAVSLDGWTQVLRHLGVMTAAVVIDGSSCEVSEDGRFECTSWDGGLPDGLRLDHPAGRLQLLPLVCIREGMNPGQAVEMALSPDVVPIVLRVDPVGGGDGGLLSLRDPGSAAAIPIWPRQDGTFHLLAVVGEALDLLVWEDTGKHRILRGRVRLVVLHEQRDYVLDLPGRWVDVDTRGEREALSVHVDSGAAPTPAIQIGWLVVGSPARFWMPESVRNFSLRGDGQVVFAQDIAPQVASISAGFGQAR